MRNTGREKRKHSAAGIVLGAVLLAAEIAGLGWVLRMHGGLGDAGSAAAAGPAEEMLAAEPSPEPTPEPVDYSREAAALDITELMVKNHAAYRAEDGTFPDWIEIHNSSAEVISLTGWALTDGSGKWTFPEAEIAGGEYKLVYAGAESGLTTGFSVSAGETVRLLDPNGDSVSEACAAEDTADVSVERTADGSFCPTRWITPGFANTGAGYEQYCSSQEAPKGPLAINEICTANTKSGYFIADSYQDWIELKNISGESVQLGEYYLSDKRNDRMLFRLPERELQSGAMLIVCCDSEFTGEEYSSEYICAPFSLNTDSDDLWLSNAAGETVDYACWHELPVNGSCGREADRSGWLYYEEPTPGRENSAGKRTIAEKPVASLPGGAYDGEESITVTLSTPDGTGEIWYTTGSEETWDELTRYTGPITLNRTTILRAVAVGEDACRSRTAVYSYFINEGHSFPIVSLVADSYSEFYGVDSSGSKFTRCSGTVTLYENGEEVFQRRGGIRLKGFTACTDLYKRNYGIYFKDKYGSTALDGLDLFGNGVTHYSSILLRAGQDWWPDGACMKNEFMERLCHEFSPEMPCQNNKYCVLYVDGNYFGIYSLKQDMNREFFAETRGVSKESVTAVHGSPEYGTELWEALEYCRNEDMADAANYARACELFDMENVIDFIVLQSYSGNIDMYNNVKLYSSPEEDGKWRYVFYDQDQTFYRTEGAVNTVFTGYAKPYVYLQDMANSLCRNAEFRDRLLKRFDEALRTTLSDEHALEVIDDLCRELAPEIERDRKEKGYTTLYKWDEYVGMFRKFFEEDYSKAVVDNLCTALQLSEADRAEYFRE